MNKKFSSKTKLNATNTSKFNNNNNSNNNTAKATSENFEIKLPLQEKLSSTYVILSTTDDYTFTIPLKVAETSSKLKQEIKEMLFQNTLKMHNININNNNNISNNNNINERKLKLKKESNKKLTFDSKNINKETNTLKNMIEERANAARSSKFLVNIDDNTKTNNFNINENKSLTDNSIIRLPAVECKGEVMRIFIDYLNYKYYYENIEKDDKINDNKQFDFNNEYALDVLLLADKYDI